MRHMSCALVAGQAIRLLWAPIARRMARSIAVLLVALWAAGLVGPAPAVAASTPLPERYICGGDPLLAQLYKGPLDEPAIPDPSTSPVPIGGGVLLSWRDLNLQLPRTNNAGPASFSDGKWWWSLEDLAHPRFLLRQPLGTIEAFGCELERG